MSGQFGVGLDDADDVADGRVGIEAQQQVRAGQLEEVHGVGLDGLAHVHQFAQQLAGRGGSTPRIWSQALAEARWWLTGQMPQMRSVISGIS